jgi:hypothetical protein
MTVEIGHLVRWSSRHLPDLVNWQLAIWQLVIWSLDSGRENGRIADAQMSKSGKWPDDKLTNWPISMCVT